MAGENGRPLVEETIRALTDAERPAGRAELKSAYASLTIGAGAVACVLERRTISEKGRQLVGGVARADTSHHELCAGDTVKGGDGPLMETDSEALLQAGNALAARTFEDFTRELGWSRDLIDRIVTHQVGSAHRRLLFETLDLDLTKDYPTVATLGNVGSVSLPVSFALAVEAGAIQDGQRVALLGIGSGLHCLMLGVEW